MIIGNKEFKTTGHTYVMGILNATPDSFSDGGNYDSLDQALYHAQKMIEEGVDIIDVGGESTRPGYTLIPDEEEIDRIAPVISGIKKRFDIPVSLDTYKSHVASEGIQAGADMINDIWGLQYDDKMGQVVSEANTGYVLMHNRQTPSIHLTYEEFRKQLEEDINRAIEAGISKDKIILDPGVGFAKSQEDNLMVMATLVKQRDLGYPILLGASKKSVINYVLDLPVNERIEGTLATTAAAVNGNAMFVRVHNVKENVRFIKMFEAIKKKEELKK